MELIAKKVVSKTDGKTYNNYYLVVGSLSIQVKPSFKKDYVKLSTLAKTYER